MVEFEQYKSSLNLNYFDRKFIEILKNQFTEYEVGEGFVFYSKQANKPSSFKFIFEFKGLNHTLGAQIELRDVTENLLDSFTKRFAQKVKIQLDSIKHNFDIIRAHLHYKIEEGEGFLKCSESDKKFIHHLADTLDKMLESYSVSRAITAKLTCTKILYAPPVIEFLLDVNELECVITYSANLMTLKEKDIGIWADTAARELFKQIPPNITARSLK